MNEEAVAHWVLLRQKKRKEALTLQLIMAIKFLSSKQPLSPVQN